MRFSTVHNFNISVTLYYIDSHLHTQEPSRSNKILFWGNRNK